MTRRVLSILVAVLMVMALIPMSALAKDAKPLTPTRETLSWDFEGETDGWTFVDNDGDGFNWELASVAMEGYIVPSYSGADCISSMSYDFDAGPLNPDNWAISPAINADDLSAVTLTFWAQAQDADYPSEHFGVAAGNTPEPDGMVMVSEWDMTASVTRATGTWYQYTVTIDGIAHEHDFSRATGDFVMYTSGHYHVLGHTDRDGFNMFTCPARKGTSAGTQKGFTFYLIDKLQKSIEVIVCAVDFSEYASFAYSY